MKNEADVEKIRKLFMAIEAGATPTALLLPWFPSPSRMAVKLATTRLYLMLYRYVGRRRDVEPTSGAIDTLIANGEATPEIAKVTLAKWFMS